MVITSDQTAEQVAQYLHHGLTISELNEWAASAIKTGEFGKDNDLYALVTRLCGPLTWEDCGEIMFALGYNIRVEVVQAPKVKRSSDKTRVMLNKRPSQRRVTRRVVKE